MNESLKKLIIDKVINVLHEVGSPESLAIDIRYSATELPEVTYRIKEQLGVERNSENGPMSY